MIPIPELGSIEPFGNTATSISAVDITWIEYRSMYDLLSSVPGFFIRDLASPGQQNQIVVNGIDDKNIGIMVDGIPYNDIHTGTFNLWNIPADAIERIEVITGPLAVFYDGQSSGGVINIVTKNYYNNRAYTRLRYSQGVDGYAHTDAMFAQNIMHGLNLSFGLTHYGFGSNKESKGYIGRFSNSNNDAWTIRTKLRYNISNSVNVSFSYLYNRTWTGLNGGVDFFNTVSVFDGLQANVQNYDAYEKIFNNHSALTFAYKPGEDSSHIISFTGYYFDRLREYRDDENRSSANGILNKIDFSSIEKGIKAQYSYKTDGNHFLLFGDVKQIQLATSNDYTTFGIKDELNLFENFTFTAFSSVRQQQSNVSTSYGGDVRFRFSEALLLYVGYSQGEFAYSSPLVIYYTQQIKSSEVGTRFKYGESFDGKIIVTHQIIDNAIIVDTINITNPSPSSNTTYYPIQYIFDGISVSARLMWNNIHLEGIANYLKQPSITRENIQLTLYPELTLDGSIYYRDVFFKGSLDFKVGLRGRYFSKQTGMKQYDQFGVWIPSSIVGFGPSGTMDFFAVGKIGDAYIHFVWENLTGNQYLLAPVYPMYDRNIRFGVSWEFLE